MTRNLSLFLILMLLGASSYSQQLYHKWYGKASDPALVFIHGGPGYNAASFEIDMAPRLAKLGYQVMVYDQRGCGRSEGLKGEFSYAEAVEDLRALIAERHVAKAHLLGHSFGGTIAVKFAEQHAEMVASIVLISAPMDFPQCFRAIQENCRKKMEAKNDERGLKSLDALAKMDTTRLEYSGTNFMYAMGNGLYTPDKEMAEGAKVKKKLAKSSLAPWLKKSSFAPVTGFFEKENYTTNDHLPALVEIVKTVKVCGIYGQDDGLFNEASLQDLETVIGGNNMYLLYNASHAVFLDDPMGFIDALMEILKE
jgi:proline iminopeptidase